MGWLIMTGIGLAAVNVVIWAIDFFRIRDEDEADETPSRPKAGRG